MALLGSAAPSVSRRLRVPNPTSMRPRAPMRLPVDARKGACPKGRLVARAAAAQVEREARGEAAGR